MMTTVAPFPNPFDDILRTIEYRFQSFIRSALDAVEGWWEWIANAVKGAVDWVSRRFNELATWVNNHLYGYGNVAALDQARDTWRDAIAPTPKECASSIDADSVRTDNEWVGRGADAYNDRVPAQSRQLREFSETAAQVSATLGDLAGATSGAITSTNITLGTLSVALGTAWASAPSIIAIPAGIITIISAIGTALIALIGTLSIFGYSASRAASQMQSIARSDFAWPRLSV